MNPLKVLCTVACLLAVTNANPIESNMRPNGVSDSFKATPSQLEGTPSLEEVTLEKLEKLSVEQGAKLMQKWYQASQNNYQLLPDFVPSPNNIPVYIFNSSGKKETANLNNFVKMAKEDISFGDEEVTIFITGLPASTETVKKAKQKLIHAYTERYNRNQRDSKTYKNHNDKTSSHASTEETSSEWQNQKATSGNLIVIDLGQTINNLEHLALLNVDATGAMIGKALVQLINDCDVSQEIIHVVAQGVAAHVAGTAGDEFTRLTGQRLRRITALDPSKILAKNPQVLTGLARGDAEFVDAIHTSAYGLGTATRVGDIDFYPSGPCSGVPGAENVLEASMRATHYFAESLRPGNERNFPAVEANSLKQYKSNNGFGKRAFMGIATAYDLKGDYMLLVNEKSPFGIRSPGQKQASYHGVHEGWRHDID